MDRRRQITSVVPGVLSLAFLLALATGASALGGPALTLVPCRLEGGVAALCGTAVVPEDRARTGGRTIRLRIAVLPARDGRSEPDPIVYLAGGPGGSAIAGAAGMLSIFAAANAHRDIVLVDQRGTGGSNRLDCPPPGKRLTTDAAVRAYVGACMARPRADPRHYTTVPAMDDLAEMIRGLGYGSVNLYGASYGGTAAQYFLAQHPELVRTAILDGATLLDVPIFERLAPNSERALRAVLARCASAPRCSRAFPRVRVEAFEMITALRARPIRVQTTTIDAAAAAGALHLLALSPAGAAEIPWIAHSARTGDWTPLALAIDRVGDGTLSTRQVMFWSIVCNEPWARWRPGRTAAASRGTYLAERAASNARLVAAACSAVPRSGQPGWTARRVRSEAPVLLVVGAADPQDPIANVSGAGSTLPKGRIVVVPAAGHTAIHLGCMPRIAGAFVDSGDASALDTSCLAGYAPPPFVVASRR